MQWVNKICDKRILIESTLIQGFYNWPADSGRFFVNRHHFVTLHKGLCVCTVVQLKIERFLINMQQLIIQKSSTLTFFSVHNCESSKSVFLFSSSLMPRMYSLQIIALSYTSLPVSWWNRNFDLLQSFHPITTRLCNPNYWSVL